MYLVSPTEPPEIRNFGHTSSVPEVCGVDIMWTGANGLCGVQRKTVADLIASVRDGRLGKEFEQMQRLAFRGLVIEGSPAWTTDGELLGSHTSWTLKHHRGVMMSAQTKGIIVVTSRNHLETLDAVSQMEEWSRKTGDSPSSLLYRGNGRKDQWGNLGDRATGINFLSGVPGIGTELAARIFDHFGKVPIMWACDAAELGLVKGIGKVKLAQLLKVLA